MSFGIGPREGVLLGANLEHAIVTNGDLTAYVCDSAATRPSSQITWGKLVFIFSTFLNFLGRLHAKYTLFEYHEFSICANIHIIFAVGLLGVFCVD